jgi:hypothetical protein
MIEKKQVGGYPLFEEAGQKNLAYLFLFTPSSYINAKTLFVTLFQDIPNLIQEENINCEKASEWFLEKYENDISKQYFCKRVYGVIKESRLDDIFYFLYEDLIVQFDTANSNVKLLFYRTDDAVVESIINDIKKFKNKKGNKSFISLVINTTEGFTIKPLKIQKTKLNIEDNYNDDFKTIHQTIIKRLSKKNDKGLVLLHGKPGTGKTSYIRYLISKLDKKVIFLPPDMANAITDPSLISILINNPNSVFIIEDAENIIMDRERNGSSAVSAMLNISDGLLSDCLNIQLICSFNTDISKVDSALLRKGRLIAKYEFNELEIQKAQALSQKLGFNTDINSPMTLTAIYNQSEHDFQETKKHRIGFKNSMLVG